MVDKEEFLNKILTNVFTQSNSELDKFFLTKNQNDVSCKNLLMRLKNNLNESIRSVEREFNLEDKIKEYENKKVLLKILRAESVKRSQNTDPSSINDSRIINEYKAVKKKVKEEKEKLYYNKELVLSLNHKIEQQDVIISNLETEIKSKKDLSNIPIIKVNNISKEIEELENNININEELSLEEHHSFNDQIHNQNTRINQLKIELEDLNKQIKDIEKTQILYDKPIQSREKNTKSVTTIVSNDPRKPFCKFKFDQINQLLDLNN